LLCFIYKFYKELLETNQLKTISAARALPDEMGSDDRCRPVRETRKENPRCFSKAWI
jgi:hypothetical protein